MRRTTAILDRIMLNCQLLAQGGPLGHRAQPRRKTIAVALDRVNSDQNTFNSRQNDDVLIALTSSQGKSVKGKKISRQRNKSQNNTKSRQQYSDLPALGPGETPWAQDSLPKKKYLQGSVRQVAPADGVVPYQVKGQTSKLTRQEKGAELNEKWRQTKMLMTTKSAN